MADRIKLMWVADSVVPTGFASVTHGILDNLPQEDYEINVLGVNYHGDPHSYNYQIWPARLGGDVLGMGRIEAMSEHLRPQIIVLFNDLWVIKEYMEHIKDKFSGKIVAYFPVDSRGYDPDWMKDLYRFDKVCVYTKFATEVIKDCGYRGELTVIPHGIDVSEFYPIPQKEARNRLSGIKPEDFVVFNGNRNQARKRIDITIKGFCIFAEDKPNAKLYLHMGLKDVGWNIIPLMQRECKRHNLVIGDRLIITHPNMSPANAVSKEHLNTIYNTADVGLNTSLGEGWGLVSWEQSACKVPQIVPDYSAPRELYENRGLLLPIRQFISALNINTEGGLIHENDVAEALDTYYNNPDLRQKYAQSMYEFIMRPEFTWESVANRFDKVFKSIV